MPEAVDIATEPTMDNPWNYTDDQILECWENLQTCAETKGPEFLVSLFYVSVNSRSLKFDPDRMAPEQLTFLLRMLERYTQTAIIVSPTEVKQYKAGEKMATVKSREIPGLTSFNLVIGKDKAYGYIRFRDPDFLSIDELSERTAEHGLTNKDIEKLWPERKGLYLYPVKEFIPFPKPRDIDPIEGNQPIIQNVTLMKSATPEDSVRMVFETRILKSMTNEVEHTVLGEVLVPEVRDVQGDIISVEEIRKAAHGFAIDCQQIGVMHKSENNRLRMVETYLAPADFKIEGREEVVKKGSWLICTKIEDPDIWEGVQDGSFSGYSIEAYGLRQTEGV